MLFDGDVFVCGVVNLADNCSKGPNLIRALSN
jgi:hypothetical protein